ncbi:MAG: ankyrin repeat domain-containing protein [Deltaproteobacteria bacterium]|nr:ankyrin repeat domain-containing protein [Deltaproteobacteria bacterium]
MDDPRAPSHNDEEAQRLLQAAFDAARAGDSSQIGRLLDQGVPVNAQNERGDTMLMLASYHGHLAATELLLARGGDPMLRNASGQNPLAGAAFKGHLEIIRRLATQASVDEAGPDGKTALMFAAMFNKVDVVQLLLELGADPRRTDLSGNTAETLAATMGGADAAALLAKATGA